MTRPTTDPARGRAGLRRPLLLGVAWVVSAAAAVGLGFLAVSLLGASASTIATPQVAAATSSGAEATPTRIVPTVTSATGEFATVAGTVYATCGTGLPTLAGVPIAGWSIDDSNEPGKVEFENGTQQVEVRVACVDGTPKFASEGVSAEDSAATTTSTHMPPTRAPEPTTAAPTSDDHGGHGGGHGSDDGPGDDSGGHGGDGGGHGSDD